MKHAPPLKEDMYEYNNFINSKMNQKKENILKELKNIIHPAYVEQFAEILKYSWSEEFSIARSLAEDLNFCTIDFLALSDDLEGFKDLYNKEFESEQGILKYEAKYG